MTKTISTKRERVGNKVIETTVRELPLFSVNKIQAEWWWNDGMAEDYLLADLGLRFCLPKWTQLHTINADSMADFKRQVKGGKFPQEYDFYYVQEYRHSGSTFHLTETDTKVDRWDSGIVGFVALPKWKNEKARVSPLEVARMLTDLWEGTIDAYEIWNNETDEVEETYEVWASADTIDKWRKICKEVKEKYNVDLEEN